MLSCFGIFSSRMYIFVSSCLMKECRKSAKKCHCCTPSVFIHFLSEEQANTGVMELIKLTQTTQDPMYLAITEEGGACWPSTESKTPFSQTPPPLHPQTLKILPKTPPYILFISHLEIDPPTRTAFWIKQIQKLRRQKLWIFEEKNISHYSSQYLNMAVCPAAHPLPRSSMASGESRTDATRSP